MENQDKGNFAHNVYFWLKNPGNQSDRMAFINSLNRFVNSSPYIETKFIGSPAATKRDVIDRSYTFCLILTFKDKLQQDKYQTEQGHLDFIEESSSLWEKVLVYDAERIE